MDHIFVGSGCHEWVGHGCELVRHSAVPFRIYSISFDHIWLWFLLKTQCIFTQIVLQKYSICFKRTNKTLNKQDATNAYNFYLVEKALCQSWRKAHAPVLFTEQFSFLTPKFSVDSIHSVWKDCQDNSQSFKGCERMLIERRGIPEAYRSAHKCLYVQVKSDLNPSRV